MPETAFTRYGNEPLIIWPNLGNPAMLLLSKYSVKLKSTFQADVYIAAESSIKTEKLAQLLKNCVNVYPLLGIDPKTHGAQRGKIIPAVAIHITPTTFKNAGDPASFDEILNVSNDKRAEILGMMPPRLLILQTKPFRERTACFNVTLEIPLTGEIKQYLEDHSFILFDLVQTFPAVPDAVRISYHALCLYKRKTWEDLTFTHISDLHISERNDSLLGVISKNLHTSISKSLVKTYDKSIRPFLAKIKLVKQDPEEETNPKWALPLEKRIINPNNMLRRFIKVANQKSEAGELDFVVATGDLVDFCIKASTLQNAYDYSYENTNWVRFLDVLLNRTITPVGGYDLLGVEPGEELLVPLFTVPGNHDYRVGHYSIQSIGIYKHLGLKWHEAVNFEERTAFAPLETSGNALNPYFQYINPYPDFFLKLGSHTFVFLDSGWDSLLEFKSLLMAEPALTGFSDDQLEFIRLVVERVLSPPDQGQSFFFSHAPIINPILKKSIRRSLAGIVGLGHQQELEEFKETRKAAKLQVQTRADEELEFRAGTISDHWTETMGFIQKAKGFALNGHTHKWREFRTERGEFATISHTGYGKKILNPFAIYWDDYTEMYGQKDPSYFMEKAPFHFQTPALGIADEHYGIPAGAYRVIEIKKNKISKISMNYVKKPPKTV